MTEANCDRAGLARAVERVQGAERRRQNDGLEPLGSQRRRQVANDVADAADFTARQRAVFRRDENDLPTVDDEPRAG